MAADENKLTPLYDLTEIIKKVRARTPARLLAGRSGARRPPVKPTAGYLCLGRLDATAADLKRLSGDEAHTVGVEHGRAPSERFLGR